MVFLVVLTPLYAPFSRSFTKQKRPQMGASHKDVTILLVGTGVPTVQKGIIALQKTKINPDRFSRPVRVNHLTIILLYYLDPYSIIEVYSDK